MIYITKVNDAEYNKKHIIEIDGNNVEVLEMYTPEQYGNKKGEYFYQYGRFKVYKDLTYVCTNSTAIHLAEPVFAIELVRFLIENKGEENCKT